VLGFNLFHKPAAATVPRGTASVQHGSGLSRRQEFVQSYKGFAKTAKDVICQAIVMIDAKKYLGDGEFNNFCVDVKVSGSKCRKLLKIGQESARFQDVLDQLPVSWTTLYELAKMDRHDFDQFVESGRLHVKLKRTELTGTVVKDYSKYLPPDFEKMKEFVVNLDGLTQEVRTRVFVHVLSMSYEHQFSLKAVGWEEELGDPKEPLC
jgi:hypothetical protein